MTSTSFHARYDTFVGWLSSTIGQARHITRDGRLSAAANMSSWPRSQLPPSPTSRLHNVQRRRPLSSGSRPRDAPLRNEKTSGRASDVAQYLQRLSQLPPVPCRDDFVKLAAGWFNLTGNVAEVGVYKGKFAHKIITRWKGRYWGIDSWRFRGKEAVDDKNFKDEATNEANYESAKRRVAHAGLVAPPISAWSPFGRRQRRPWAQSPRCVPVRSGRQKGDAGSITLCPCGRKVCGRFFRLGVH